MAEDRRLKTKDEKATTNHDNNNKLRLIFMKEKENIIWPE
jgi:hypothetical protein